MEAETLFLFVPYFVKNRNGSEDILEEFESVSFGDQYKYTINRACFKRTETGERFKRTAIHFEPVIGNKCFIVKIVNKGRSKEGLAESVYFPFIFESLELAKNEVQEIQKGDFRKYLHSKEKFTSVEILAVKITEY